MRSSWAHANSIFASSRVPESEDGRCALVLMSEIVLDGQLVIPAVTSSTDPFPLTNPSPDPAGPFGCRSDDV